MLVDKLSLSSSKGLEIEYDLNKQESQEGHWGNQTQAEYNMSQ